MPSVETGHPGPAAKCRASSLTPYGEKLDAVSARVLPALLGINSPPESGPGSINRVALEKAIASPLSSRDLHHLGSQWPTDLISNATVTAWTSRLVAACDGLYVEHGMNAYIEAVTDLIFDEGNDKAGLPGELRDFCAMLVKNALEAGLAQGLDRKALQGLRNTVILRFLMGNVFIPHLRPTDMRASTGDAGLYNFDRQLFKRFCDKTAEIIDIDAEAIVLLAVARQSQGKAPATRA